MSGKERQFLKFAAYFSPFVFSEMEFSNQFSTTLEKWPLESMALRLRNKNIEVPEFFNLLCSLVLWPKKPGGTVADIEINSPETKIN